MMEQFEVLDYHGVRRLYSHCYENGYDWIWGYYRFIKIL